MLSRSRRQPTHPSQQRSSTISASTQHSRATFVRTDELYAESQRLSERYGDAESVRFLRGNRLWIGFMRGRWDETHEAADAFIAECEAGSPHTIEVLVREIRGRCSCSPAEIATAPFATSSVRSSSVSRRHDPFASLGSLALTATMLRRARDCTTRRARSRCRCHRMVREIGLHGGADSSLALADDLGIGDELRDAVAAGAGPSFPFGVPRSAHPGGRADSAADIMESAGNPTIEANIRKHARSTDACRGPNDGRAGRARTRTRVLPLGRRYRPTSRRSRARWPRLRESRRR